MKPAAAKRKTKARLDWKDCECGCHGSTLDLLGIHFSLYHSLGSGKVHLAVHSHHAHLTGTPYPSYAKAMAKVREVLQARLTESEKETVMVKAWLLDG